MVPEAVQSAVRSLGEASLDGGHAEPPFVVVDLEAFRRNAASLVERANDQPIRVSTAALCCRYLIHLARRLPGFSGGVLAASLPEALDLARDPESPVEDVLVGYPSVDRAAVTSLVADRVARERITLTVDDSAHLELVEAAVRDAGLTPGDAPIRICLDVDLPVRAVTRRVGGRRTAIHDAQEAGTVAAAISADPTMALVGLRFQDAPVGLGVAARLFTRSARATDDLAERRTAVVGAVTTRLRRAGRPRLEFVCGGTTATLHVVRRDPVFTEVLAGSGLLEATRPGGCREVTPVPAVYVVLPVIRRPAPDLLNCAVNGYGDALGGARQVLPVAPKGLSVLDAPAPGKPGAAEILLRLDGGRGGTDLAPGVGSPIWFRPASAGGLVSRVDSVHLVHRGHLVGTVPTYRGELRS